MNKEKVDLAGIRHIAIIADGNGRWAKKRLMPRAYGHKHGAENIRKVCKTCLDFGLETLSLFCLSTENLKRPKEELDFLFSLLPDFYEKYAEELRQEKIRTIFCGSKAGMPDHVVELMEKTEEISRSGSNDYRMKLVICFNYGGRDEIANALVRILQKEISLLRSVLNSSSQNKNLDFKKLDFNTSRSEAGSEKSMEESLLSSIIRSENTGSEDFDLSKIKQLIEKNLYLPDLPMPDLIIRTAGEMRLSNFWLWQAAYAEFYSSSAYWPDFGKNELLEALNSYKKRERRYGLLGKDSGRVAAIDKETKI